MTGRLYLVGTPIGNLGDVSDRVRAVLASVSLIAAEDTRRTRILLKELGVSCPLTSYHDHNERTKFPELLSALEEGKDVAVVSDAGMPVIADPGWHIIQAAIQRGIEIIPVPGPTAFVLALVVSGLPVHRFTFEGYLPKKSSARRRKLEELAEEPRTMIFYETPHSVRSTLRDALEVLGDRKASLSRELTKKFEETRRGTLSTLLSSCDDKVLRGEFVLVVSGTESVETRTPRAECGSEHVQ
ncbi:MAG TPA: 16S rRNA (cytidine(1402)-2'-O)-methyltransferase [Candidatus Latescibacteria bacterium]|nr:16S rRNA (cytidine(1402)-2'-O)-methyltransferase [Candidatus Latescibacterota bacterium]HOS63883.1 16S rRNA (cytidine(1402)-2'-O)-methyltransferase [Candidatus Latescibacterota bacterium]HPC43849.1 16S rRNA (cytidine(1402)-2'-O)-methyltransferase [Candidatus Latescibacterota bacterium]HPK73828.1 16S rRNA (cytidine(1402)-2'-O)-methyltransferase [Candidatus Latescibacterota bacterium]HRU23858.1 16S rRNA (cytidine(1402)-2'-O)-methyltransferase [Candidatus Latescibacterota bacterium]